VTYGLWVTQAEKNAMATVLSVCPNEPLPGGVVAPAPAPGASYANCDAVRAAGAAPIHPGDPGWEQKFDRDDDGVGCE
jgi:hypothetical protein